MVILSLEQIHRIYEEALDRYPKECCGILLGERKGGLRTVKDVYTVPNAAEEKRHHFAISEEMVLSAELMALENNYEILGVYHSHPDCEAIASLEDRNFAIPGNSYPIISVKNGQVTGIISWEKIWENGRENFIREKLEING